MEALASVPGGPCQHVGTGIFCCEFATANGSYTQCPVLGIFVGHSFTGLLPTDTDCHMIFLSWSQIDPSARASRVHDAARRPAGGQHFVLIRASEPPAQPWTRPDHVGRRCRNTRKKLVRRTVASGRIKPHLEKGLGVGSEGGMRFVRMMSSQFLHGLPCNRTAYVAWHFPPQQQPTPARPMPGHDPLTLAFVGRKVVDR